MESEFDFAAQKHRRLHKLAAQRLKQRQRPSAIQGAGVVGSTSEPSASSSSQSASSLQVLPEQPPHTPQFKVAGSQVLVTSGMPVDEAASEINGVTRRADKMSPTVDKVGGDEVFERLSVGGPFTCFMCVKTESADERFLPHKCCVSPQALWCCKPCFVAWAESQVRANAVDTRCCYCGLNLDGRILSRLVCTEAFELFCEMSLQHCLGRDQHFIWCSKCFSGGWVDPKEALFGVVCVWILCLVFGLFVSGVSVNFVFGVCVGVCVDFEFGVCVDFPIDRTTSSCAHAETACEACHFQ